MSRDEDDAMEKRNASPNEIVKIALIAILVIIPAFVFRSYYAHPFVNPHLPSPPYVWPEGCKPNDVRHYYNSIGKIPKSCMVNRYYFTESDKYNFPKSKGIGRNYFRVGADAINFNCFDEDNLCYVSDLIPDVFIENGK
jgi:hypothetical protein